MTKLLKPSSVWSCQRTVGEVSTTTATLIKLNFLTDALCSVLHFCLVIGGCLTEKSKLLKKIVMKSLLLRKITRERRIKREMSKIK
jgi:hypothetical protein